MKWLDGLPFLSSLRDRASAADDDDHADMGTAFGLDASFDAVDPPTAGDEPPTPSWESRLVRRSGL